MPEKVLKLSAEKILLYSLTRFERRIDPLKIDL